jgi:hypothetical protein
MQALGLRQERGGLLKESRDFRLDEYSDRETELWNVNRTKDLIEVLEYWWFKDGKVWRTPDRQPRVVLLRAESRSVGNPFWHQGYPFVHLLVDAAAVLAWRGTSDDGVDRAAPGDPLGTDEPAAR